MKKSKLLVVGLTAAALGLAGAATGTVAWFQADAKARTSTDSAAFKVKESTLETGDVWFVVEVTNKEAVQSKKLEETAKDGKVYVVSNGYWALAKQPEATEISNSMTLVLKAYNADPAGEDFVPSEHIATQPQIAASGDHVFTVTVTPDERTRVHASDPWANAAGSAMTLTAKVTAGVLYLGNTETPTSNEGVVVYSIAGSPNDSETPVDGTAATDPTLDYDEDEEAIEDIGGVEISLLESSAK